MRQHYKPEPRPSIAAAVATIAVFALIGLLLAYRG